MDRRRLLGYLTGCAAAAAGCLSPSPSNSTDSSSDNDTQSANQPTNSTADIEPSLTDIVVRKSIGQTPPYESSSVLTDPDYQFVLASVQAPEGDEDELEAFEIEDRFVFETDEQSWDPSQLGDETTYRTPDHRRPVVVFQLPSPLSESTPQIRLTDADDATWSLPDDQRERLAEPAPQFELDELDVPERVSQGEELSVSLSVENVSAVDGQFLAAVVWPTKYIADDNEAEIVRRSVEAGETITESLSIDTQDTTEEAESVSLRVTGYVSVEREVQVEDVDED